MGGPQELTWRRPVAQVFVESLDRCFENVCELDLIFHFDEVRSSLQDAKSKDEGALTGCLRPTGPHTIELPHHRWTRLGHLNRLNTAEVCHKTPSS